MKCEKFPCDCEGGTVYWPFHYNPCFPFTQCNQSTHWVNEARIAHMKVFRDMVREATQTKKKEAPTMQVEYNGFTGELVKLERITKLVSADANIINAVYTPTKIVDRYNVSIYDSEKKATISADGVKLSDIKFLGGAVSFG